MVRVQLPSHAHSKSVTVSVTDDVKEVKRDLTLTVTRLKPHTVSLLIAYSAVHIVKLPKWTTVIVALEKNKVPSLRCRLRLP